MPDTRCGKSGHLYAEIPADQIALAMGPDVPAFWSTSMIARCDEHAPGSAPVALFAAQIEPCDFGVDTKAARFTDEQAAEILAMVRAATTEALANLGLIAELLDRLTAPKLAEVVNASAGAHDEEAFRELLLAAADLTPERTFP